MFLSALPRALPASLCRRSHATKMELWHDSHEEALHHLLNDLVLMEQPSFVYAGRDGAGVRARDPDPRVALTLLSGPAPLTQAGARPGAGTPLQP